MQLVLEHGGNNGAKLYNLVGKLGDRQEDGGGEGPKHKGRVSPARSTGTIFPQKQIVNQLEEGDYCSTD